MTMKETDKWTIKRAVAVIFMLSFIISLLTAINTGEPKWLGLSIVIWLFTLLGWGIASVWSYIRKIEL